MKSNLKKIHWSIVAFIILLFVTSLVLLVMLLIKINPQLNKQITTILWGVVTGLTTFTIAFIFINKFLYTLNDDILSIVKKLKNNFKHHDNTTKTILDIVQGKYMSLINYKRTELLGTNFYSNIFADSCEIKVSGITVQNFLTALTNGTNTIIKQLTNRENIRVKILFMHPENTTIAILNEQERRNLDQMQQPATNKIMQSIALLKTFWENNKGQTLAQGSSLEIRLTKETINMIITYAGKENNQHNTLLMGLLFGHKQGGPIYQIPSDFSLYGDCLDYFDTLYENAQNNTVFLWSDGNVPIVDTSIIK